MEIEKQNFHWIFEAQFVRKGEENFYQSGAFKELFKGICSFLLLSVQYFSRKIFRAG